MKKVQNIALIALLTMIIVPQTMLCEGMTDIFPTDRPVSEQPNETPIEKSQFERIKEWANQKAQAARDAFTKRFNSKPTKPLKPENDIPTDESRFKDARPARTGANWVNKSFPRKTTKISPPEPTPFGANNIGRTFRPERGTDTGVKIKLDNNPVKTKEPLTDDERSITRWRGKDRIKDRITDWSVGGIRHAFKQDDDLLREFLQNPGTRDGRLTNHEAVLKNAMTKLSPQERAKLLTEITRNEIAVKKYASDDAAMIFEKNITKFNTILPKTDLIVLLHDNKSFDNTPRKGSIQSYRFDIINMSKYDPTLSPKQNFDHMNQEHDLEMSLNKFIRNVRDYYQKNNPTALQAVDKSMNDANISYLQAHPAKIQEMMYQFFHSTPTPLNAQETAELETIMKILPTSQKAAIFTNVIRQKIKEIESESGQKLTSKEIARMFEETLVGTRYQKNLWPKITSPNDLIMITHDRAKTPNSYRFQIANMGDFHYNFAQTADQNAKDLAEKQNLQINSSDLVDSIMDFYYKNNRVEYQKIFNAQINDILNHSKDQLPALTNLFEKELNRQLPSKAKRYLSFNMKKIIETLIEDKAKNKNIDFTLSELKRALNLAILFSKPANS